MLNFAYLNKKTTKKDDLNTFGILVVIILTCFVGVFSYLNEPIGDDILASFDGWISFYVDEVPYTVGDRIQTIDQGMRLLQDVYINWSGRMTGYVFHIFGRLLPKYVQAVITAFVLVFNVLVVTKISIGNDRHLLKYTLISILLFQAVYWYRYGCYFEYMWTMVSVYSIPVLFILIYYYLNSSYSLKSFSQIIVFELLGVIVGFSHEILVFILMIIIGTEVIRDVHLKKMRFKELYKHIGLIIGYIMCFFAPGNFNRMGQSHDAFSNSYWDRLKGVVALHRIVLIGSTEQKIIFGSILSVAILHCAFAYLNSEDISLYLTNRIGIITAVIVSPFICAVMPHYPVYGEDLWVFLVYIVLFDYVVKLQDYVHISKHQYICITGIVVVIFVICNFSEVNSYTRTSLSRRTLIYNAVINQREEVIVPSYDDRLSTDRYLMDYLNGQDLYDTECYIKYYGVKQIIE